MALPDADRAIYQALAAAGTVTDFLGGSAIYNLLAPADTTPPYVVYYRASGLLPNNSPHNNFNYLYTVEAIANVRGSAEALQDRVYATLHNQELSVTGFTNYWSMCEGVAPLAETVEGKQYWRYIGTYRLRGSED